jgi:hypothetical protein
VRGQKLITSKGVCDGESKASIDRRDGTIAEEEAKGAKAEGIALGRDQGRHQAANRQAPRQEISSSQCGGWRFATDERDSRRNAAHASSLVSGDRRIVFAAIGDPLKNQAGEDAHRRQ